MKAAQDDKKDAFLCGFVNNGILGNSGSFLVYVQRNKRSLELTPEKNIITNERYCELNVQLQIFLLWHKMHS